MAITDSYPTPPVVLAARPPQPPVMSLALAADPGITETAAGQAGPARWQDGITYQPYAQTAAQVRSPNDTTDIVAAPAQPKDVVSFPFVVTVEDVCSAFGWEAHDYIGRARLLLDAALPQALGAEFWSGALATAAEPHPYLTNTATVVDLTPGGGPPSVKRGQQLLEDALANSGYGGQGMIHVLPQSSPDLTGARPDPDHPGRLLSVAGNVIVIDPGYTGSGPGGTAAPAGQTWLYATDVVQVWRDEDVVIVPATMREALNRRTNTVDFAAMTLTAVAFDQVRHFAVRCTTTP